MHVLTCFCFVDWTNVFRKLFSCFVSPRSFFVWCWFRRAVLDNMSDSTTPPTTDSLVIRRFSEKSLCRFLHELLFQFGYSLPLFFQLSLKNFIRSFERRGFRSGHFSCLLGFSSLFVSSFSLTKSILSFVQTSSCKAMRSAESKSSGCFLRIFRANSGSANASRK